MPYRSTYLKRAHLTKIIKRTEQIYTHNKYLFTSPTITPNNRNKQIRCLILLLDRSSLESSTLLAHYFEEPVVPGCLARHKLYKIIIPALI